MDIRVSEILEKTIAKSQPLEQKPKYEEFKFTLEKLSEDGLQTRLTSLIEEISIQGERICTHMDIADLRQYRNLIASFINEVVTHSHEFTRDNFLDRRGRHRVYGNVKIINKELDSLAEELLKNEKDAVSILSRTGQIQGLILDLVA